MSRIEIQLTDQGYLHVPADVAQALFPQDTLVALVKGPELWLLPTRGAAGGGLLLKQRNAKGDRSVLLTEVLPPHVFPGRRLAFWDEENGALRVALKADVDLLPSGFPAKAVAAKTFLEEVNGRWVVYLEAGFWAENETENPVEVVRHRIADYATRREAEVAASWMERGAERDIPRPPSGT